MSKILSIIVPTYNMETLLRHTLNSLLISNDNFSLLEILVINDGSKDSSLAIAKEYERMYPDVFRTIDKPNGNYGSCVNRGLKEATGKYIKVLDADDSLDTLCLDKIVTKLQNIDVDTVITDFVVVDSEESVIEKKTYPFPLKKTFSVDEIKPNILHYFWHHALIHKTQKLRDINYTQSEGVSYSDDEWVLKPVSVSQSLIYIPLPLYRYLIGREGQTMASGNFAKLCIGKIKVANALLQFYRDNYDFLPNENKRFMKEKFHERCKSLYRIFLISYHTSKSDEQLRDFDAKLKSVSSDIYNDLNGLKLKYIGYPFVLRWRQAGSRDTNILKILRLLRSLNTFSFIR